MFAGVYIMPTPSGPRRLSTSGSKLRSLEAFRRAAEKHGRENEMLFQIADDDSNQVLDFDEWSRMVNSRLPAPPEDPPGALKEREWLLRKSFEALDANKDGRLEPSEYFFFALREALLRAEREHSDAFRGLVGSDRDVAALSAVMHHASSGDAPPMLRSHGSGTRANFRIGRHQVARLADHFGFEEEAGVEIFQSMLTAFYTSTGRKPPPTRMPNNRARIDATFFVHELHERTKHLPQLLFEWSNALAETVQHLAKPRRGAVGLGGDVRGAVRREVRAPSHKSSVHRLSEAALEPVAACERRDDVPGMLRQLRKCLAGDIQRVRTLFLDFDTDGSFDLGMKEFGHALTALGVRREKEVTEALFDELDYNGNYRIGFAEFKAWLVSGRDADINFEARLGESFPPHE
jgi:Ca2+-binding EF-hand superfamily protein